MAASLKPNTNYDNQRKGGFANKTLGSLLRYMEGIEIIVELKTGKRFRGQLESADGHMNLTLDNVVNVQGVQQPSSSTTRNQDVVTAGSLLHDGNPKGDFKSIDHNDHHHETFTSTVDNDNNNNNNIFSSMNIRGSTIRYIHFPDNADLTALVKGGVDREKAAANKYKRGKRK